MSAVKHFKRHTNTRMMTMIILFCLGQPAPPCPYKRPPLSGQTTLIPVIISQPAHCKVCSFHQCAPGIVQFKPNFSISCWQQYFVQHGVHLVATSVCIIHLTDNTHPHHFQPLSTPHSFGVHTFLHFWASVLNAVTAVWKALKGSIYICAAQ